MAGSPLGRVPSQSWSYACVQHRVVTRAGFSFEGSGIGQKDHRRSATMLRQMPSHYETIPTVVSLAAEHQNSLLVERREVSLKHFCDAASGVLHQRKTGDAQLLNGDAVHLTHLFGCEHLTGHWRAWLQTRSERTSFRRERHLMN